MGQAFCDVMPQPVLGLMLIPHSATLLLHSPILNSGSRSRITGAARATFCLVLLRIARFGRLVVHLGSALARAYCRASLLSTTFAFFATILIYMSLTWDHPRYSLLRSGGQTALTFKYHTTCDGAFACRYVGLVVWDGTPIACGGRLCRHHHRTRNPTFASHSGRTRLNVCASIFASAWKNKRRTRTAFLAGWTPFCADGYATFWFTRRAAFALLMPATGATP